MNFDELQVVWNSQTDRPTFQFDETALIQNVRQRSRAFGRIVSSFEWAMILCLLFMVGMCLRDPLLEGHDYFLILPAVACSAGALFVWKGRRARLKRAAQFDDSLLGMIEMSIAQVDDHIDRLRTVQWWCILPLTLTLAVGFYLVDDSRRYLFYFVFGPLFALCMGFSFWGTQREIRCKLLPKRADLESLRRKILA